MAKKNGNSAPTTSAGALRKTMKAGEFFGDVKAELFKIDWTDKEELKVYTRIVVIATFVLGLCIYGMDLLIRNVLVGMGAFVHLITG